MLFGLVIVFAWMGTGVRWV